MIAPLIYINKWQCDVDNNTFIALTVQGFKLGRPGSVLNSFTNRITLPPTANNLRTLALPGVFNVVVPSIIRSSLPIRIVQDGVEFNGTCQITSVNEKAISLDIQAGGLYAGFQKIKGKYITDITTPNGLEAIFGKWGDAERDSHRTVQADGVLCPVINTGQMLTVGEYRTGAGGTQNGMYPPAVQYHYILQCIFAMMGYRGLFSGNIFADAKYLATYVLCKNRYDTEWVSSKSSYASKATQNLATLAGGPLTSDSASLVFDTLNLSEFFTYSAGLFTAANPNFSPGDRFGGFKFTFQCRIPNGANFNVNSVKLYRNGWFGGTTLIATANLVAGSSNLYSFTEPNFSTDALVGDTFNLVVNYTTTSGLADTMTITDLLFKLEFWNGDKEDNSSVYDAHPSINMYISRTLPKISIEDFLQHFLTVNGLAMKESNGTLYFKKIDEIINDYANTVDWSNKVATVSDESADLASNPLSNTNNFRHLCEDDNMSADYLGGVMLLTDNNLTLQQDLYTSPFNASLNYPDNINGIDCLRVITSTGSPVASETRMSYLKKRIFLTRDKYAGEPGLKFNAITRTNYKVGYFWDIRQADNLKMQDVVDSNYKYQALSLNNYKYVEFKMVLSSRDVYYFDIFKPVHINGARYIVDQIANFVPWKSTTVVKLVKI